MMQITEDTPPDMLAGAMDLTVHLPTETTVKMSVDRSTPMMDLLVQITTAHHLQQSGHILQALEMAPSSGRLDKILPYKPNTPIGVLDTQHVKVIPKNRSIPIPKSVSGGHQPFESTFRLQVHLPRNQLYVIRVSQNVYLEDIMKKVCHEKNLDSSKYEFRHPANLDEVLNPKLTLSDYQITEVYVVLKGTIGLTQTFSANDIMASRKEEERKQMQARTGGGVLSLIFKRGKQSMGSGSISSENRSISPSHSDDSRSVTPPAIQQPLLSARIQPAPVLKEKPKAPQRKRRPAPKPPQSTDHKKDIIDKPPSEISNVSESNTIDPKKLDNGLTICHSRNSSDSSGYHEPSVLSDNCNTSLPRRSKSTLINEVLNEESQFEETVSVSSQNLTTMSNFSKSTSSIAGRKKKAAPPPPPIIKTEDVSSSSETVTVSIAGSIVSDKTDNTETESVVAETVPTNVETKSLDDIAVDVTKTSPVPMRRKKLVRAPPKPAPRVKSITVDMPISQARNPSISKEDKLQLNAEENYNNMLNEASPIDANKSISNDSDIQNNLTSKIDHLQLTDDGETVVPKSIKNDEKLIEDTPIMALEVEEPNASSAVQQEIFHQEISPTSDKMINDISVVNLVVEKPPASSVVKQEIFVDTEEQPPINDKNITEMSLIDLEVGKPPPSSAVKQEIFVDPEEKSLISDKKVNEIMVMDLEVNKPSASSAIKQEIFIDAEEKPLISDTSENKITAEINIASSNHNTIEISQDYKEQTAIQEKQPLIDVCNFEQAELEILQLKNNLDEKLNLAKGLHESMEPETFNNDDDLAEIPKSEYDFIKMCDLAMKEIDMLRCNSYDNTIIKETRNDDLISLDVSKDDNIPPPAENNEIPVPKRRMRNKKNKIIDKDLSTTNSDKINNNQLVDAESKVSKNLEDSISNNSEIGSNSKESGINTPLSFESIRENVPITNDNHKVNNDQLVDATSEVTTFSDGAICDNKNTGTNNNESAINVFLPVEGIYLKQPNDDEQTNEHIKMNNNQSVDVTSEVPTSSKDMVSNIQKSETNNNENLPKRRVSKSRSISSNLSSLDSIERLSGLVAMDDEDSSSIASSKNLDNISVNSKCSSIGDMDDFNRYILETPDLKHCSNKNENDLIQLEGIDSQTTCTINTSTSSLKSSNSDENLHGEGNIKEWNGTRKLNNISTDIDLVDSTGIVGDHSDTESAEVRQRVIINTSNKNIDPIKRSSISSTTSLKSINSEVIEFEKLKEVVNANLNCDNDRNTAITPKNVTELQSRNSINSEAGILKENHINIKDVESQIISNCSPKSSALIEAPKVEEKSIKSEEAKNEEIVKTDVEELDDLDHEWQYQLPSPPKAFRDSSPTNLTDLTNYDTITLQDFKEHSILSHSELFEKLGQIKDSQYESESISDFSSVCNGEEKSILSKLTLENLEKRQSLVYNRELSTSLKNAQENNFTSQNNQTRSIDDTNNKRSSVVNELEKVIKTNKPLMRHNSCIADTTLKPFVDNNLPNFKISTYDTFKRKINIFEDESIRSNSDNSFKSLTYNEISNSKSMPYDSVNCFSNKSPMRSQNLSIAKSIENLSIVNIDCDEVDFKKPLEYTKHNSNSKNSFYVKHKSSTLNGAGRSESFSANKWIPQNPVQRSRSQVALNKFTEVEQDIPFEDPSTLTKSNSLFDVSGLQSLEVIRSIQNKLNTPNNSTEDLLVNKPEPRQCSARSSVSLDHDSEPIVEKSTSETTTTKTYRYQGPPSINLSTWSERPKTKVSLKEDRDYKIKNVENCKVNRMSNTTTVELNTPVNGTAGNGTRRYSDSNSCTIQVNGMEPIRTNQDSSNVTIKVGSSQFSKQFSRINKFVQNMENPFTRKPLGNINKIEANPRPHSIAQDSDFDISRVPIVRAVELKKTIKETSPINTSVTQINALNNEITNNNKYADIYHSTERLQEINGLKNQTTKSSVYLTSEPTHKPVTRGNSFAYSRNLPKVMGFTDIKIENDNTPRSRKSWNVPNNYEPLPLKIKPEPPVRSSSFLPNSNVPFSNLTLKRVESKKPDLSSNNNIYGNVVLRNTTSQFKREEINQDVPNNEKPNQFAPIRRISNGTNAVPPCPPPLKPIVPKKNFKRSESCADPRDELLNSIRNFGGQKGLRHVKAV